MAKLILSMDGLVLKEIPLTKERMTIGRRASNDIQIDNLAISGEHAAVVTILNDSFLEDLNSTNGTYVNGKAVKKQLLQDGDSVEVGKYKIKFVSDVLGESYEKTMMVKAGASGLAPSAAPTSLTPPATAGFAAQASAEPPSAAIKVLSGAAAGREVPLTKVVTTIGKPGVAVAAITRRQRGFVVHHVEGAGNPTLNGAPVGAEQVPLKNGDLIELAGTQMQFVQA